MARSLSKSFTSLTLIFLFASLALAESNGFSRTLKPSSLGLVKEKKASQFHFFLHETHSGNKPSIVIVADPDDIKPNPLLFGQLYMFDDPLTIGPDPGSKLVGRAQGMYGLASTEVEGDLVMAMTFVFKEGKYNGSSLSLLGKNSGRSSAVQEMAIVGGSGLFRFATGFAQSTLRSYDSKTGDSVFEYNLYVNHF